MPDAAKTGANEKRSTTGPMTRLEIIPAVPPTVPVSPTAVASDAEGVLSLSRARKLVIQIPWANINTHMSAIAEGTEPASEASQEAGVRSA